MTAKPFVPLLLLVVFARKSWLYVEFPRMQEPSASEPNTFADGLLVRLTKQSDSELAPLGLRALVRWSQRSVFFLILLYHTPHAHS